MEHTNHASVSASGDHDYQHDTKHCYKRGKARPVYAFIADNREAELNKLCFLCSIVNSVLTGIVDNYKRSQTPALTAKSLALRDVTSKVDGWETRLQGHGVTVAASVRSDSKFLSRSLQ